MALPDVGRGHGAGRGGDPELDVHGPEVVLAGDLEAGAEEDPEHGAVLAEHLGDEATDAAVAAGRREVLQQQAAEPVAVLLLVDQERDLGHVGGHRLRRAQRHDPAADGHDQAGDRGMGRVEEVLDVVVAGLAPDGEEAHPQAVQGRRLVQRGEGVVVARPHGADDRDRPVDEQDVGVLGVGLLHGAPPVVGLSVDPRPRDGPAAGPMVPGVRSLGVRHGAVGPPDKALSGGTFGPLARARSRLD